MSVPTSPQVELEMKPIAMLRAIEADARIHLSTFKLCGLERATYEALMIGTMQNVWSDF